MLFLIVENSLHLIDISPLPLMQSWIYTYTLIAYKKKNKNDSRHFEWQANCEEFNNDEKKNKWYDGEIKKITDTIQIE